MTVRRGVIIIYGTPSKIFSYSKKSLSISIGENEFTDRGIQLSLNREGLSVRGRLNFGAFTPWPVRLFSPGAMGWYAFVPKMEDYHGVISFYHELQGTLNIDGRETDFSRGSGYVEKDWGTSFPGRWIWMQTNNFAGQRASLSLSVATIPWRKKQFTGYIIGFWLDGRLFPFSSYTGGKIAAYTVHGNEEVDLVLQTKQYELRGFC